MPVNGLVEGAFRTGFRAFAGVKSLDDAPGLFAFGNLFERFFADIADHQIVDVAARQAAAAEANFAVVADGKVKKIFAWHIQRRRQFAQPHGTAQVGWLDGAAPVVEIHGEIDADLFGQVGFDVFGEILRVDDLAGFFVVAEPDDDAGRFALRAVVFQQIADAGHGVVIMFDAINFFIRFPAGALRADENAADAEVNQLFIGLVAVYQDGVRGQNDILDLGLIHRIVHFFQQAGVHERVAHDRRQVEALATDRRPFIHRLFENVERHDARLEGFIGDDLGVGAERAFGVANVRHARHQRRGWFQVAVCPKFLRRDDVFGNFFVFATPPKIFDVVSAPINHIGSQAVGMHGVVNAPTQFSRQAVHH